VCPRSLRSYTYEDVVELSLTWAKELKSYFIDGIAPTLGILSPYNLEYGIMVLGGFAAGVRVYRALYLLRLANASVIVIDESVYEKYLNVVTFLKDKVKIFVRSEQTFRPIEEDFFQLLFSKTGLLDMKSVMNVDPESVAIIGFTGDPKNRRPKGVYIQHKNYVKSSYACSHEAFFPLPSASEKGQETIFGNLCYSHLYELQFYLTVAPLSGCRIVTFENDNWTDYFTYLKIFKPVLIFLQPYAMEALIREDIPTGAFESVSKDYLSKEETMSDEGEEEGEWFRTGDAMFFDDENFFYCKDKVKDAIQVLGKKVFPSSIENILKEHEDVIDACVIGIPDNETTEEAPKAFVITKKKVEKEEIIAFVHQSVSPEMWLRGGVTFVDILPRNYKGKLNRKCLRTL
ncbi:Luciferin 4-monooxygenase, partial [Armadillidium nasatum]